MTLLALTLCCIATIAGKPTAPADKSAVEPAALAPAAPAPARANYTLDEILAALRVVETGGLKSEGRHAIGDGGAAIGPYQIHRNYWKDARLPGRFEDCRDPEYARAVVLAYWKRYAPRALEALDAETLARVHNGGPDGHKEACTAGFWRKMQRELERLRAKRAATKPSATEANAPKAPPANGDERREPRRKLPPKPELV